MNNAQIAAKRFSKNPNNPGLVTHQLQIEGMSNDDILTGLSIAAGFIRPAQAVSTAA